MQAGDGILSKKMAAAHGHHHHRPVAHFLFPIIVWLESAWVLFGTLAFISAIFYVLGNYQAFTARTLLLLLSTARFAGLASTIFALAYIVLTIIFRIGGGPRRLGHLVMAALVFLASLLVSVLGFTITSALQPIS